MNERRCPADESFYRHAWYQIMKFLSFVRHKRPGRRLLEEIQLLSILVSMFIIIGVQAISLVIISGTMIGDLKDRSVVTADEIQALLREPLYNVDDIQVLRIGEALLSSGRISGIVLNSTASGLLLDSTTVRMSTRELIAPLTRDIYSNEILLGSVTLHFSDQEVVAFQRSLLYIAGVVILAVILANLAANRFIVRGYLRRPLSVIVEGIDEIAGGNYSKPITLTVFEDVNQLINLLNDMAGKISLKNRQLREINTALEDRVAQRTIELEKSVDDLRRTQERLIESEKLTALGHLSAGMAHEMNTPLGAILSSNRMIQDFIQNRQMDLFDYYASLGETDRTIFRSILEWGSTINEISVSLSNRKLRLAVEERMSEMGLPVDSVLAELIVELGLQDRMDDLIQFLREENGATVLGGVAPLVMLRRMSDIIELAGTKAATVVSALRSYLHPDSASETNEVSIDSDINQVLLLMHNMLKYGVRVHKQFNGVHVYGSSDKLSQVWLNLIRNAAQALDFSGDIILTTGLHADGRACVTVQDNGPGIPENLQNRVFDPFFTTKQQGEGMGLGLDICKRIIEGHGGTIELKSRPGETIFTVLIPGGFIKDPS